MKIFNEKEVDELTVLDIDATAQGEDPDYAMIAKLAAECRMPLCYGGGVKTVDQAQRIVAMGVEKVSISPRRWQTPRSSPTWRAPSAARAWSWSSTRASARSDLGTRSSVRMAARRPAGPGRGRPPDAGRRGGKIIVNSIDNDGVMKGYDLTLIEQVREAITLPMTALGGAGS